ncbi:unnamed protein product [Staurois parvus]|uniref:Uncharacterized protein n=1 Tax=Staurois parvus TaxID=386267 RepID=A0ABN9AWM7_9NEOB|nr:unnamed protein product [Staurois parvus]
MYINSRMGAVQGRVAVYKCPPAPCLCSLPGSTQHLRSRTPIVVRSRSCDH